MRIVERLARLEKAKGDGDRMTRAEIEQAAGEFDSMLSEPFFLPVGISADQARSTWRSLVETPGPGYLQRVFAGMSPDDLRV